MNETISYKELMKRHQEEVNNFPLGYAFGMEQFREMMQNFGLSAEKDLDKIVSLGSGIYLRKSDMDAYIAMCKRHKEEKEACMAKKKEGDAFLFQMFYTALCDTEYGYTGDFDDALEQLGYTLAEVRKDERLYSAFQKAKKRVMSGSC